MKTEPLKVFSLIGVKDFYMASRTIMPNMFEIDTKAEIRQNDIEYALKEGRTVTIRPANTCETFWAFKKLELIQKKQEELDKRLGRVPA